jgi:hypothetical protein
MRRSLMLGLCVAAVAVTASAAVAASGSSSHKGAIHVVALVGHLEQLDYNRDGIGFGDDFIFRGPLVDPATGNRVGTAYGDCQVATMNLAGGTFRCSYLLDLPDGNLTTEGLDPRGDSDTFFAITGGTGSYSTAAGEAEYVDSAGQTDIYIDLQS